MADHVGSADRSYHSNLDSEASVSIFFCIAHHSVVKLN